jgi:hypothetical protein
MVGWTPSLEPPKFPKDDKNVSPRRTPKFVNARPCRHCGSGKHWDYKCRHSQKGEKQAQVNFITLSNPDIEALSAYDDLYYGPMMNPSKISRIFMSPSRVLIRPSQLNQRMNLAWRNLKNKSLHQSQFTLNLTSQQFRVQIYI